jgi:hypothetical protein
MTALTLRHAWLQKHPTPTAATGEFHWHPANALGGAPTGDLAQASIAVARGAPPLTAIPLARSSADVGDLRLSLVDRLRGVVPPAALWQVAPGRVVWAQVFAATAPGDGRRYCGLAVTVAESAGASAGELLASLIVPAAAPWSGEPSEREVVLVRSPAAALSSTQRSHRDAVLPAPISAVRALISGGVGAVDDPARPDLPAWIASLEAWLPASITTRPRQGEWRGGTPQLAAAVDPVAAVLLAAWCPADGVAAARSRRAWAILTELAATQGRSLDDIAAEMLPAPGALSLPYDLDRALTPDERAHTPPGAEVAIAPWVHAIHHWGRGRLDDSPAAPTLLARLADLVISRVLADHVADGPERAAIDQVRWHALLPAVRRRELLAAIVSRAPSIGELIEREPRSRVTASLRRPEVNRA